MTAPRTASELCAQCGLCCNGVLFRRLELQPEDSPRDLAALGIKLKRRNRKQIILQPCPAHQDSHCTIYDQRPCRCRRFQCRQLEWLAAQKIDAATALTTIQKARLQVARVQHLLRQTGGYNENKALKTNYERAMAEPVQGGPGEAATLLRHQLMREMKKLEEGLENEFRIKSSCHT